jgi:hypothetical protein
MGELTTAGAGITGVEVRGRGQVPGKWGGERGCVSWQARATLLSCYNTVLDAVGSYSNVEIGGMIACPKEKVGPNNMITFC